MRIEYRLTKKCNMTCSYCYDDFNESNPNIQIDFEGLDHILNEIKHLDYIEMYIHGGEPTRHPELNRLINFFQDDERVDSIIIQSNATKPIKNNASKLLVNYSYHPEFITLKKFIDNCKKTPNLGTLTVMDEKMVQDKNYLEYKVLKSLFPIVELSPIINENLNQKPANSNLIELEDKWIFNEVKDQWFYKSYYDMWKTNTTNTKGKLCNIEFNELHFDSNKVYNCFNSMTSDLNGVPFKEFKYKPKQIKCPHNWCYFSMRNLDSKPET